MAQVLQNLDRIEARFDDPNLVANAGLIAIATLVSRVGLEALINSTVRLVGRVGGSRPGRKILTLVHTIAAGGSHIDHADMLRAGATGAVLGHRVMAPSTLGTFLRAFTFGHIRQLDRVLDIVIGRVWGFGAGPGTERLVVDLDSTICEVFGNAKHGASYGYTKVLGYHPILATRADTGEIIHARLRKGAANTARGARRFVSEFIARVRRGGACGEIVVRADSGFWSYATIERLDRLDVRYTIAVRTGVRAVTSTIAQISDDAWSDIDYTPDGEAQVAETAYKGRRLIVRRTRLLDPTQLELWPDWRYHAFLTDLTANPAELDAFHRQHATIELAIRDIKEGAGLEHLPSGNFWANAAWLACAVLAHNLVRWSTQLGDTHDDDTLTVARTVRTQLIAVPARIVRPGGQPVMRLPQHWPWAQHFTTALDALRALPQLC